MSTTSYHRVSVVFRV